MAQIPTLCEIFYGFDIFTNRSDVDDFYTPYRLSLSNRPRSRSLPIGLPFPTDKRSGRYEKYLTHYTFFGHDNPHENFKKYQTQLDTSRSQYPEDFYQEASSYYDYLRDYYIAESSSPSRVDTVISPQLPQRCHLTVPEGYVSSSLGKYSSLRHIGGNELNCLPTLTRTGLKGKDLADPENNDTLMWVDSLSAWISTEKCSKQKPYISIINNPPYIEKYFTATQCRYKRDAAHTCKGQCDRYHNHMLTFEEIYTRRCEQKTQLNPRLKHYRNAILERVNRKETKRQRKAYSTPLYNSDVHTCRRKTTPLSANACPLITKNKIGKEETVEEEDSEDELIQKLTEVFGKDTSRSCPDVKVSERTQNLKKIKNFKKKELTVLVRKEKRSPRNARVETKASNQHSVEPLKKLEKFKVQIPSHYTKAKPKKTHNIPSGAAAPEFKLKQQDTTSLISIPRKEEKKATIPEIPSIDSKPTSMTLPEKDFTPRQECHVSTLITHVDDSKEIEVKADEDIFVKQTDVDIFGKRTDEDISVKQTNQAQDIEDVEDKETEVIKRRRSPVRKREKIIRLRTENEVKELPSEPKVEVKKQSTWIYGDDKDDTSFEKVSTPLDVKYEVSALPTTPNIPQLPMEIPMKQAKCHIVSKHLVPVDAKPRWGNKKYDKSYDDERHRAELAERRRKKQMDMYEKLKLRKSGKQSVDEEVKKYASFDEYDFLAKYCIFDKTKRNMIQHAFNIVDEENKGWLNSEDVMVALRIVNSKLTETEEEYLSRIIEMTGYKITNGADFKLFSVLSALSTRISLLDSWMKNKIGMMDFKTLEMKLFMCKTLWECNVDHETNTIPLEQVMIELRAGGVSYEHECEVKRKLGHLKALDLFDFLTYVPLFIMIHETVIDNPLDESRIK